MMKIGGITLDHDLIWVDEFQDTLTAGVASRAIDGHLVVQLHSLQGGRMMTLSGDTGSGWQKRSTVIALQVLAEEPTQQIVVEMPDGRVFNTNLRAEENPAMTFTPVTLASAPDGDFWYYGTINLRIL
jgi:hypothetical protein